MGAYEASYLAEIFTESDGMLVFRTRPISHFPSERLCGRWNKRYAGSIAGHTSKHSGYTVVGFDNRLWQAHRVVAALHGFNWALIDHKNGDRADNNIANLREATTAQNAVNSKDRVRADNLPRGVHRKRNGRYVAYLYEACKTRNLGTFDTSEEAEQVRTRAAVVAHGEFVRL